MGVVALATPGILQQGAALRMPGRVRGRFTSCSAEGYTAAMSLDRILISLGILLLVVSAVLAAITWL